MALSSSIEQITKIVGPALGGLLVAAFGISVCYMIDSATFVLSAIILLGLPRTAAIKKKDTETSRGIRRCVTPSAKKCRQVCM